MAQFIGFVKGQRGEASRLGSKASGLDVIAASYQGCIEVRLWHDEETGKDMFQVVQNTWQGVGVQKEIASGIIGVADAQE